MSYDSVFLLSGSDIPHLLHELERSELGCVWDLTHSLPQIYLVITISHFKGFWLFSCSFCWSALLYFYHFNLRDVCHRGMSVAVFLVQQSSSSQAQLIISYCQARRNRMKFPACVYHPRSVWRGNCVKQYMPTTDR